MSFSLKHAAMAVFATVVACAAEDSTDNGPPPPAPETLFDTLPAATPDKLRGVWKTTTTQGVVTLELRIRFTERYVVGAAKCTVKDSDQSVLVGGSTGLVTQALDAASGKVEMGSLGFQKTENNLQCGASLPGDNYDFTIEEGTLSFRTATARLSTTFTKIGD